MLRNKLCLLLALCLFVPSALAESPSIISDEMIQTETVNYSKTAVVEVGEYKRDYNATASEYYPNTYELAAEIDNASFLKYHVARSQQVKKGDILATFTIEVDEAATASAKLSLERAQEDYLSNSAKKREEISEMLREQSSIRDAYEREVMTLRIRRAQVAYEQYCYQQECAIARMTEEAAELEEANSSCYLYAPYDGVITHVAYKREGEKIYANETLITMYREDGMLLRISNDQLYFRYGMPVSVTIGPKNNPEVFQGHVVAADNILPENRRLGHAFIQLDPFEGEAPRMNRMTATGTSECLGNVMVIPRRAVTLDAGKNYVECLVNGNLQKRFINIGLSNMSNVWVLQGLDVGDTIILD